MSSKIILNLAISLDGFIADSNGGYDWIEPSGNRDLNTKTIWSHETFLERISAVVMGKRSYDQQLHTAYSNKQVYVVTSKKLDDYDNIHVIGEDVCREICELQQKPDGDIYLFGGGLSVDPLLKAGIIDEYIVGIIPIILGKGIPLFLHNNPTIPLHLTHYYVEDGVVVLRYVPRSLLKNDEDGCVMEQKLAITDIHKVLAGPAIRALNNAGITSIDILCAKTERELLALHGFGKSGLQRITQLLSDHGLSLNKD